MEKTLNMNNSKLSLALHYASLGIPVLPLHYLTAEGICSCGKPKGDSKCKPGKHPLGGLVPHGLTDATTDPATIHQWFDGKPYNLGICTGEVSGFFVLDRDDRDGGDRSLADLESRHSSLPATLSQQTGNGVHYLFQMPTSQSIKNSAKKLAPGLDIRGTGGYIVAAPSVHQNGNTYTWLGVELPTRELIAPAPTWLLEQIAQPINSSANDTGTAKKSNPFGNLGFHVPDQIQDGEGREDFLLRYAGHLRGKGLDQSTIERILLDYNSAHIQPPLDDAAVLDRARRYETADPTSAANDSDWPDPEEITATLPPVPPFNERMLPTVIRAWVNDIADRMQCPVEFLAVGVMVAAGAVVGNRIGVQPKQHDTGWVEVPNLWGAIVGRPGVMKTPALSEVLRPLRRLESAALAAFTTTRAQFEVDRMMYEIAFKKIGNEIKKGATILPGQLPISPEEPQPPRYLLNDSTYQKLGAVLGGNPHGVMVFQDELSGLLMRLDTAGQESARAFYLEAWNGQQSYTFDRMERGTVRIPRLCFSLLGGLQPSKLREYLRSAVYGGKGDDGLAQRLQMLVYPDIAPDWVQVDRLPDLAAAIAADAVFTRLASLDPVALGARQTYPEDIPVFGFADDAQGLFNTWWSNLENGLRRSDHHPALESHISKYRKLVPALALLDHLLVGRQGDIGINSLKRAIAWQRFLLAHAKRAYAAVTSATMDSAKALSKHIQRGALSDGFTVREVYRHNWSLLSNVKEATEAVEVLVDLGWLRAQRDERVSAADGRPTVRHFINPRLKAAA
jgi:putative DNA primase/helicase